MTTPARPSQNMHHVLVVEDDHPLADLLAEVLTYENCTADVATNGFEALDRIRGGSFDAIICDIMMPRLGGEELYKSVTKEMPSLAERFIFITGEAAQRAGFTDFITPTGNRLLLKPLDIEEFRLALRELFAR